MMFKREKEFIWI